MIKLLQLVVTSVRNALTVFLGIASGIPRLSSHLPQTHTQEFSLDIVRPDDLLVLTLHFYNLRLVPVGGSQQIKRVAAGNGFIVARFPPQSFGERAFFEESPGAPQSDPPQPPPVASRISGSSQVVFRIDDASLPLDFSLEQILEALTKSEPIVQPSIRKPPPVPGGGAAAEFGGTRSQFTAIEAPYRLVLSPSLDSRWQHALRAVTSAVSNRTELWHSRLSPQATGGAVWSPDYIPTDDPTVEPPVDNFPFRMSLNKTFRHEIVRSSADRTLPGARPFDIHQLMLSSQGAWLHTHGEWQTEIPLVEWEHIMTGGRDQYARVVREGHLLCFGHRAVVVTTTERKVQAGQLGQFDGKPIAYLRQRKFIYVREPTKTYVHHDCPFRSVTIKTLKTPNLDDPALSEILPGEADNAFWPHVAGEDFLFRVLATDYEGQVSEFHIPLAFIIKTTTENDNRAKMNNIINLYNSLPDTDVRRGRPIGGQKIAFAPKSKPGDTTFETATMVFGATGTDSKPHFLPASPRSVVDIPAVRQISGNTALSTIEFDPDFLITAGNNIGNLGEVFAKLITRTPVKFSSDQTGGMVAPNFDISGLSRAYGPVGGTIAEFAKGSFKPPDIFKGVKILGGIDLAGIIFDIKNVTPLAALSEVPKLTTVRTTELMPGGSKEVIQTSYRWDVNQSRLIDQANPPSIPDPPNPPKPGKKGMFSPKPGAQFFIESVTNAPLDGTTPSSKVHGELKNFKVTLLPDVPLVALHFTSVSFTAQQNAKVDFAIIFKEFEFLGVLSFVNNLQRIIPMDGFDDPPFLDLILPPKPRPGVRVGFTQGVPTVGIGIFTLQNISFSASFYLPFLDGPANLRLAFCERHQPFTLTVSLFGGGGFFAIDIGFEGVQQIEAALEFGAAIALNLGVASGSACIMGGVYYLGSPEGFLLSAYFRAAGNLSVLGIITVSVELYISLNFESRKSQPHGGKLWGQASITVKIKIAFFSIKVGISIEREFAGSDPKFFETVSLPDWEKHCLAFADCPA